MSRILRATVLLALSATALEAQVQPGQFSVTTRIGAMSPEEAASRDMAGLVGLDTEYSFSRYVGLGLAIDVSRGNTKREHFVASYMYGLSASGGGDTVFYQYLSQPVTTLNLGAYGTLRLPVGERFSPFVMGGVGTYTMILDAQVAGSAQRKVEMSVMFGGGAWLRLSESTGLQFDVRAMQMQDYDRTFLDPSKGRSPNRVFFQDFPDVPPAKNTALNTIFTLGFRYIP